MKLFWLALILLACGLDARADDATGRVTITFSPTTAHGGVLETDLRQVGDQILGNSSMLGSNIINLTINNGTYQGPTGRALTSLKCNSNGCDGFINGDGVDFSNVTKTSKKGVTYVETKGTVHKNIYSASYSGNELSISGSNSSLNLKQVSPGKYKGQASIGIGLYDVSFKADGSMSDFLADPALVAIFLGAAIGG